MIHWREYFLKYPAWLLIVLALLAILLPARASDSAGTNTVIWISLDGVRPDYLERGNPPFISGLAETGVYIRRMQPPFPTLTFPSHIAMVTGTSSAKHGIVANAFYDRTRRQIYHYPSYGSLLKAEPIWITATRAGIPTAVYDWVLSHGQRHHFSAAYFGDGYRQNLAIDERLNSLVTAYRGSIDNGTPLRLLMGYLPEPDATGHRLGPDSNEVIAALNQCDRIISTTVDQIRQLWSTVATENDRLIVLVTSDHGMTRIDYLVHPEMLTGLEGRDDLVLITSGNLLQVYFREPATVDDIRILASAIKAAIESHPYATAYTRPELPTHWEYNNADRTADVLVVLDPPYSFSRRIDSVVTPCEAPQHPRGMHGYDVTTCPDMETIAILATVAGKPGLPPIEVTEPMSTTLLRDLVLSLLIHRPDFDEHFPGLDTRR